jgi:hypothetical protein
MVSLTLPVNQWYLRRKGYHVQGRHFLTPVVLLLVAGLITLLPGFSSWWVRGLVLAAYPVACLAASPPLRADLGVAWTQARETLRGRLSGQLSS